MHAAPSGPLAGLLRDQAGVVSRRQALSLGLAEHDLSRLRRRRDLTVLHPGVYVDHTGEPTWLQQAWAAVLVMWPAALTHGSALRAVEGPGSPRRQLPIEVAVASGRHPVRREGVRVVRRDHLADRVEWHRHPPRMRFEHAVIDVAAEARTELEALHELSGAVQGRRTTAARLLDFLESRHRVARRDWQRGVLADVAAGTCSVLEHGHLHRVDRPHGLAPARRQVRDRAGGGVIYRDVEYDGGLVAELDGRLFHDSVRQRDRDMDRDLLTALTGRQTVRLSYGQVFDRPCWTAAALAQLLAHHGWRGRPRACGPTCHVGRVA